MVTFTVLEYVFWNAFIVMFVESNDILYYSTDLERLRGNYPTYTVFKQKLTWYEARAVCESIGGDLATIQNTTHYIKAIQSVNEDAGKFLESNHFFTSAVKPTSNDGEVLWITDCISTTNSLYTVSDSSAQPGCLEVHYDHYHQTDCNTAEGPFLCETKAKDNACNISVDVETDINRYNGSQDDCLDMCYNDVTCWAAITTSSLCINAVVNGYGSSSMNISTKQCPRTFQVIFNETQFSPPSPSNGIAYVETPPSCTVPSTTSAPTTTPVTGNPVTPRQLCSTTSTVYETRSTTSTIYETSTSLDLETSTTTSTVYEKNYIDITSTDVETSLTTSTVYETSTSTSVETSSSTSTVYETRYINITSTLCASGATSVLSSQTLVSSTISPQMSASIVDKTQSNSSWFNYTVSMTSIHPKNTSLYRRSVTSANDTRTVAMVIGLCAITTVIVPIWAMILSDLKTIAKHVRDHSSLYSKQTKNKYKT